MLSSKWPLIAAMKAELMQRDPLGQELTRLLANPPSDPWDDDWWDERQDVFCRARAYYEKRVNRSPRGVWCWDRSPR